MGLEVKQNKNLQLIRIKIQGVHKYVDCKLLKYNFTYWKCNLFTL